VLAVALIGYEVTLQGRYSKIAHPCALLSQATIAALVPNAAAPDETPGKEARCAWNETLGIRTVLLHLSSNGPTVFSSAQSQARQLFEAERRSGPSSAVPEIGDEAVRQSAGVLLVRSDNLVWTLSLLIEKGPGDDALLRTALEIQLNLRSL
jgi:hypothetical protein